jgi:acetyl-CoA carboxylase biotin carboxyl carrier protein
MDFKQIQDLIKIINKSNIGELTIEENDFKITIKQKEDNIVYGNAPVAQVYQQPVYQQPEVTQPVGFTPKQNEASEPSQNNLITIKSPMIGTFYRRPSPDKPLLADVGESIAPGKVLCIIEAMKLFNEIESEISGKIVKVLVDDASPVEFDQPLFMVEPA